MTNPINFNKYAEGTRISLTTSEAQEIAHKDPPRIWIDPQRCSACEALKNIGQHHKCGGDRCILDIINK